MKDENTKQSDVTNRLSRCKLIFLAAFFFLFILTCYMYKVITWEHKPDPESERLIRQIAAKKLNKEINELSDYDLAQITELNIKGISTEELELSDIKLLEKFTNLQELSIVRVKSPLKEIPTWKKVLAKTGIYDPNASYALDLSPLNKLSNLQTIDIYSSQVSNLNSLRKLKNLKGLTLYQTYIPNLKPIKNLKNLQYL